MGTARATATSKARMKSLTGVNRKAAAIIVAAVLSLIAGACATRPSGTGTGSIPHSTGADQVLLRVAEEGGFVASAALELRVPQFTLLGDGTVITMGAQTAIYPGPAAPPLLAQTLDAEGIQAVLTAALEAGLGARHQDLTDLGSVRITDMATTVITFNANGVTTRLKVYALGDLGGQKPGGMSQEEFQLRTQVQTLVTKLGTLEQWLPKGSIAASRPYVSDGARVFVSVYRPDPQLTEPEVAWPLSTPLAGFGTASGGMDSACGTVTGSDWTGRLRPLVDTANQLTPWTSGGTKYALAFRPLLPDENGC